MAGWLAGWLAGRLAVLSTNRCQGRQLISFSHPHSPSQTVVTVKTVKVIRSVRFLSIWVHHFLFSHPLVTVITVNAAKSYRFLHIPRKPSRTVTNNHQNCQSRQRCDRGCLRLPIHMARQTRQSHQKCWVFEHWGTSLFWDSDRLRSFKPVKPVKPVKVVQSVGFLYISRMPKSTLA